MDKRNFDKTEDEKTDDDQHEDADGGGSGNNARHPETTLVRKLSWGSDEDAKALLRNARVTDDSNSKRAFDYIIASDIVHWPELYDLLIESFVSLSGLRTQIYLSYEQRKLERERMFFQKAHRHFHVEQIPPSDQHQDYVCKEIFIYKLTLKQGDDHL